MKKEGLPSTYKKIPITCKPAGQEIKINYFAGLLLLLLVLCSLSKHCRGKPFSVQQS